MNIERIEKISQIDEILHLMQRAHTTSDFYKGKSFAAYVNYCGFNLMFPNQFMILVFKDSGKAKGYVIAHIGNNQFENHCVIVDAYMEEVDEEATRLANDQIEIWAEENGCIFMESMTNRIASICRKYGYEPVSQCLRKSLGGAK